MLQKQFLWNSVNVLFFLYFVYTINSAYIFPYCLDKIEFYMHTHANHSSLWRMLFQTVLPLDASNSSLLWPSPSRLWEGELFCLPHTVNERTEEDKGNLYLQHKQRISNHPQVKMQVQWRAWKERAAMRDIRCVSFSDIGDSTFRVKNVERFKVSHDEIALNQMHMEHCYCHQQHCRGQVRSTLHGEISSNCKDIASI